MVAGKKKPILRAGMGTLAMIAIGSLASYSNSGSPQSSNGPNGNAYGYYLKNNTPGFISRAVDQGPADPNTVISVTAWLKLQNENQLGQLVQQLYNKHSPNFHKLLNPTQFNPTFSPHTQLSVHGTE